MMTKRYEQTDKLQVCFTRQQAEFLTRQKKETGDRKSDIVRHAVQELMIKKADEQLDWKETGSICSCGGAILKKEEGFFISTRCSKCKMGVNILKHTIKQNEEKQGKTIDERETSRTTLLP